MGRPTFTLGDEDKVLLREERGMLSSSSKYWGSTTKETFLEGTRVTRAGDSSLDWESLEVSLLATSSSSSSSVSAV